MVMEISAANRERISKAISAAEANSDGEIVAVTTPLSDS
jgi:putative membrane protein